MLLKNTQWITEQVKEEFKKYHFKNGNENTANQNLWDAAQKWF